MQQQFCLATQDSGKDAVASAAKGLSSVQPYQPQTFTKDESGLHTSLVESSRYFFFRQRIDVRLFWLLSLLGSDFLALPCNHKREKGYFSKKRASKQAEILT